MERVSRQGNASAVNEQTLIFSRTKTHPYVPELERGEKQRGKREEKKLLIKIILKNNQRNPNIIDHHGRNETLLPASREKSRFRSLSWEQYDPVHQKYLEIVIQVKCSESK
ncbi:hypothetical protein ALC57_11996 [Trachymyrmex cornetzi]|uniref:Uncharacterized protein n=1 Tax=Trachymyrmex cornetzi TaxID=471704 RepID=A0A151J1M0_9HYME|nr:hypothetical protein ALC57_11996 [Trachymyrmex cornetzi]